MLNAKTTKNFTWEVTLTSADGAGMPGIVIHNGTSYIYIQVESWRNHGKNIVVGVTTGATNDDVYNTSGAGNTNTLNSLTYKVVRTQDSITLYASGAEIMTFTKDGYTFVEGVEKVGDTNYAAHQTQLATFFGENMEMAVGFGSNSCDKTYTCTSTITINE